MSDLERTIAGLPLFEQRCPLQKPVLGHFCALQIVFQKKKKQRNVIPPYAKYIVLKQYFDLNFSRYLKVSKNQNSENMRFVGNIFTWYIRLKKGPPKKRNVPLNIVDWDMLPP